MKKLYILILKAFISPFISTFFIVMFILLMFFLFKYIDDLVGKGLTWGSIVELMFYNSATNVAMALPLAVLLSSIMTFGTLGENYELVAIKSIGVSLQKAMMPLLLLIVALAGTSFWFNDYILPIANLKFYSLINDVTQQKPTFLIKEGVFNTSIKGYAIKVGKKESDNETLRDIIIYDENNSYARVPTIIRAQYGKMFKAQNGENEELVLKLYNGVRYEEKSSESGNYNPRQQFYRLRFKETEQKFDLSSFKTIKTDEKEMGKFSIMMNLKKLTKVENSKKHQLDSLEKQQVKEVKNYFTTNYYIRNKDVVIKPIQIHLKDIMNNIPKNAKASSIQNAQFKAQAIKENMQRKMADMEVYRQEIRQIKIDFWRKFTLSMSCLVLFFIGAPLGAIIRKGGLGLPIVIAVAFFLVYHVISTVSEKSAKQDTLSPFWGMWMPIFILSPLGAFLTYKSTIDSAIFDINAYKLFFIRLYNKIPFLKKKNN